MLISVGSLINRVTIKLDDARDELEFFQIKLESHDVIFAEGAPVETCRRGSLRAGRGLRGARGESKSRFYNTISPRLDRRSPVDVIRDRLEKRAVGAIV